MARSETARRRPRIRLRSLLLLAAAVGLMLGPGRGTLSAWLGGPTGAKSALGHRATAFASSALTRAAPSGLARARADARLRRAGHGNVPGGVVIVPSSFSSADGSYDLLVHFHGDVKIVVESMEMAKVNAVAAIVNLGVGSGVYEDEYATPGAYETVLEQVQKMMVARGLEGARPRRVALSSWSAGYGAISSVLQQRKGTDPLDAVLLLDGLHCGRLSDRPGDLNRLQLAPFLTAARTAARGGMLFAMTHTEIDPVNYVGSGETADYLVESVKGLGEVTSGTGERPVHLKLKSAERAVEPSLEKRLEPLRDVQIGGLHVRGFRGRTREHHAAHLIQMGATLLPELARRWSWES
jgi:hypothetical protein